MEESILITIKKMLGMSADYKSFDTDVITHINSVLFTLNQLAVGPDNPACITGDSEKWIDIFGELDNFHAVKTYIYLKVRILFDPPANSTLLKALQEQAAEYEWRLNVQAESGKEE